MWGVYPREHTAGLMSCLWPTDNPWCSQNVVLGLMSELSVNKPHPNLPLLGEGTKPLPLGEGTKPPPLGEGTKPPPLGEGRSEGRSRPPNRGTTGG